MTEKRDKAKSLERIDRTQLEHYSTPRSYPKGMKNFKIMTIVFNV